ncbi:hypothetical protein C0993_007966 [Termitomyces sp. T159_Od127]|nr:hypothetical protein C0993_007966 [Termitomyces sp. T159_Od127]
MTSQTLQVLPSGANGSQASLVLPASPSLVPSGDDLGPGATRGTGSSQGISEHIYPLMPYKVPRYKRKRFMRVLPIFHITSLYNELCSKDEPATFEVSANQVEFSLEGELPKGWKQLTHPEGQPYFYNAEKVRKYLEKDKDKIITECWIWDPQTSMILDGFIDQIEDFTRSQNLTKPEDVDLLLELNEEDGVNWCGYYYVSASTHSVFWLEPFDISHHVSEVRGNISPTHISIYYIGPE